jgi:hypothetical protein
VVVGVLRPRFGAWIAAIVRDPRARGESTAARRRRQTGVFSDRTWPLVIRRRIIEIATVAQNGISRRATVTRTGECIKDYELAADVRIS